MNSKKCSIRPFGQRSITSTFLFRASNRSSDCGKNEEIKAPSQKSSHLSLSDFLNGKLHRSSVLPSSAPVNQGKELPFSSPLSREDLGERGKKGGAEPKFSIDGDIRMFNNVEKDKNSSKNCNDANETEFIDEDDRKRKNLFEGHEDKPPAKKRLIVLGEDSKPRQSTRKRKVVGEEPGSLFNHYENGGGWWDENMEGVDNEEVGCNDAWEGVGYSTLGGIEWH